MNFELFVSKTLLLFLINFRWLLFYWIGVVLVDLCKGLTVEYLDFKVQLLLAEPSLQASFDRVEIGFHGRFSQTKTLNRQPRRSKPR